MPILLRFGTDVFKLAVAEPHGARRCDQLCDQKNFVEREQLQAKMAGAGKYPPFTPSKSEPDDETVEKALRGELKAATPRDTPKGPDRFGSHRSLIDSAFSSEPFGQTED